MTRSVSRRNNRRNQSKIKIDPKRKEKIKRIENISNDFLKDTTLFYGKQNKKEEKT